MSLEKDFFTHLFYKKIFFYTSNENVCIAMIRKKGGGRIFVRIVLSKNRRKEVLLSFSFRIYIYFSPESEKI